MYENLIAKLVRAGVVLACDKRVVSALAVEEAINGVDVGQYQYGDGFRVYKDGQI